MCARPSPRAPIDLWVGPVGWNGDVSVSHRQRSGLPRTRGRPHHSALRRGHDPGLAVRRPGTLCDPGDACNAHLMCTDTDPRMQPGGCPISKRSFKDDIHYLSPAAVGERYQALLGVKLAEYRYKTEAPGGTPHLGFIIDDGVPAEALRASHDQVDLYGYTTLTVAAIQSQAREIEALKAEVAELRALLKAK